MVACPALVTELAGVLRRDRFRRYLSLEDVDGYTGSLLLIGAAVPTYPATNRWSDANRAGGMMGQSSQGRCRDRGPRVRLSISLR